MMRDKTSEVAVRVQGLSKQFGFTQALDGIDLTLPRGELMALFGPNGAGKSTLLRILSTLMRPTSGRATLLGYDLAKEGDKIRRVIGVLTHQPLLFGNLTAYENLRFYGQMFGVKPLDPRIEALLEEVGLADQRDQQVQVFSRGMQQRLAIARALIHEPDLLFLDEPHTGLDQSGMEFLGATLKKFLDDGKTAIMTCHDFARGLELGTQVAILNEGRLLYCGSPPEFPENFGSLYESHVGRKASIL